MNTPTSQVLNEFADAFACKGKGKGMTRDEILEYFRKYSDNMVDPGIFGDAGTKAQLFCYCVERLHVEDQYRALIDIASAPPDMTNTAPTAAVRAALLRRLFADGEAHGLVLRAMSLTSWRIKRQWLKTIGRIEKSPAAAITSARALLEVACIEILTSLGKADLGKTNGDLGKLVKNTRHALELPAGPDRIASGVATMVYGVAEASNAAGDRHGTVEASEPTLAEARLICDACFALTLYLVDHQKIQKAKPAGAPVAVAAPAPAPAPAPVVAAPAAALATEPAPQPEPA